MGLVSVERDIQHELLNARSSRRKPGHIPYPLKYSTAMASFDVWDHMFFSSCCQSLTMHQFDTPPETILDLGCGTGYWAIEAAKQWPRSTIVGVDIAKIQPPLASLRDYKPIASRVQWINANFLDGLPFLQSNHFDFVRIVGIGLAVPEDEWQHLLEEVFRVMKPGAVIEIIEEDLLFPCATPPHRKSAFPPFPSTLELTVPSSSSITLCSTSSADERSLRSPTSSFPAGSPLLSPTTSSYYDAPTHEDEDDDEEPSLQNHGRLKKAWDSMLSSRFICSNLLSVLPFYIASSSFGNVKSHPACKIPLPHNSGASSQAKAQQMRMMHEDFLQRSSCASPQSSRGEGQSILDLSSRCQESSYAWSRMHLAKTVNTIKACKEAIWQEYARLFPKGRSASVRHINGPRPVLLSNTSCREAFEADWRSWENDMEDRIGMRDCLIAQLSWSEPPGERPDWRVWRSHLEKQYSSRDSGYASLGDGDDPEDLCRSVAGFVGWKPN